MDFREEWRRKKKFCSEAVHRNRLTLCHWAMPAGPSSLFMAESYSTVCVDGPHFVYLSSVDGHWVASTFWPLWLTLLWTWGISISLRPCFQLWGCIPRSGISGLHDNSVLGGSRYTVWHSSCPTLYSHQRYTGFQFFHAPNICYLFVCVCF